MEALQEGAAIEPHGRLAIAALEGLLESHSVHPDRLAVQPHVLAVDDDRVFAQRLP